MKNYLYQFLDQFYPEVRESVDPTCEKKYSKNYKQSYYLLPLKRPADNISLILGNQSYTIMEQHMSVFDENQNGAFHFTVTLKACPISSNARNSREYCVHLYYDYERKSAHEKFTIKNKKIVLYSLNTAHENISLGLEDSLLIYAQENLMAAVTPILKKHTLIIQHKQIVLNNKITLYQNSEDSDVAMQLRLVKAIYTEIEIINNVNFKSRNQYKKMHTLYLAIMSFLEGHKLTITEPIAQRDCLKNTSQEISHTVRPSKILFSRPRETSITVGVQNYTRDIEETLAQCKSVLYSSKEDLSWFDKNSPIFNKMYDLLSLLNLQTIYVDNSRVVSICQEISQILSQWETKRLIAIFDFVTRDITADIPVSLAQNRKEWASDLESLLERVVSFALDTDRPECLDFMLKLGVLNLDEPIPFKNGHLNTVLQEAFYNTQNHSKSHKCLYYLSRIMNSSIFSLEEHSGLPMIYQLNQLAIKDAELYNSLTVLIGMPDFYRRTLRSCSLALKNPNLDTSDREGLQLLVLVSEEEVKSPSTGLERRQRLEDMAIRTSPMLVPIEYSEYNCNDLNDGLALTSFIKGNCLELSPLKKNAIISLGPNCMPKSTRTML